MRLRLSTRAWIAFSPLGGLLLTAASARAQGIEPDQPGAQRADTQPAVLPAGVFNTHAVEFQPTSGDCGNNNGQTVGWRFDVLEAVTVDAMSWFDEGQDGLEAAHEVALWDLSGTMIPNTNVVIPAGIGAPLDWIWRTVDITPVVLAPGNGYIIGGYNGMGLSECIKGDVTQTVDARLNFVDATFSDLGPGLERPTQFSGFGNGLYGPGFQLSSYKPEGRLFGVNSGLGGEFLAIIDKLNASLFTLGGTGITSDAMCFAPDGTLYAADNDLSRLVTLYPPTGQVVSVVGPFIHVTVLEGMAAHPVTGELFGIDSATDELVSINTATGVALPIGPMGVVGMAGLSFSSDGGELYAISYTDGCLYKIDPTHGGSSLIGCDDSEEPLALATDPLDGQLYSADWTGGGDMILSRVDDSNGSRTDVGVLFGGFQVEGLSFESLPLGTKYCAANANSTGSPADISASGSASSSAGDLTLHSAPVPNQPGVFFHGANPNNIPFGNGRLCTTGTLRRGTVVTAAGNSASYTYDNSILKRDLSHHIGSTRHFQHWFRDPMGGGAAFNLSNGIAIGILPK